MEYATLTFQDREQAKKFASDWAFYSKTGYVLGAGTENVNVTVYDVTDEHKEWIDNYVAKLNG